MKIYSFWVYLQSTFKIFIYWPIFKIESSTDSHEMRLYNTLTMSIYRDILKADIDIRKIVSDPSSIFIFCASDLISWTLRLLDDQYQYKIC